MNDEIYEAIAKQERILSITYVETICAVNTSEEQEETIQDYRQGLQKILDKHKVTLYAWDLEVEYRLIKKYRNLSS